MLPTTLLRSVAVLLVAASCCQACVYLHGDSPMVAELSNVPHSWDYSFQGENWAGVDKFGKPWVCVTGKEQTPINIPRSMTSPLAGPAAGTVPKAANSLFNYGSLTSNGSDINVLNNGHTIQVEFKGAKMPTAQIKVPLDAQVLTDALKLKPGQKFKVVNATALQMHWHAHSEHFVDGAAYPLELHIVHMVKSDQLPGCTPENGYVLGGCLTVLGIMYALSEKPNAAMAPVWDNMPLYEQPQPGWTVPLPKDTVLDMDGLLPANKKYATYAGSLTTPPCYEGLLWHVMTTPVPISQEQYRAFGIAIGSWQCAEHPEELPEAITMFAEANYDPTTFGKMWAANSTSHADSAPHHRRHLKQMKFPTASRIQQSGNATCAKIAHGSNYRYTQPRNARSIKYSQAPLGVSMGGF